MKAKKNQDKFFSILFSVLFVSFMSLFASSVLASSVKVVDARLANSHGVALLSDGTAWTFGRNYHGQLGNGKNDTSEKYYPPVKIMSDVKAVDACNVQTAFLKTDGSLWMCGYNEDGELGDGTTASRNTPVKVMDNVQQVSLGSFTTAIVKTDGSLWITGGDNGALFNLEDTPLKPVKVMDDVKSVCAGYYCLFYIKKDNTLWACGDNSYIKAGHSSGSYQEGTLDYGRLGIDRKESPGMPEQVMTNVKTVASERDHTAILKMDGTLWMTGSNDYGEIGDGTLTNRHAPVRIMDGVQKVDAGDYITMIQKADGSVWVCGEVRSEKASPVPLKINGLEKTKMIDVGSRVFMAVDENGSLWTSAAEGFDQIFTAKKELQTGNSGIFLMGLIIGDKPEETKKQEDTDLKKGDTFNNVHVTYSFDGKEGEITLKKTIKDIGKLVIPAIEQFNGKTYKVTGIAAGAFKNSKVKEVSIGANVKTIGKDAFKGCTSLTKVSGGKGVTQIGNSAFESCKKLKSVTIGNNVTAIGTKSFYGCTSLTKVTVPAKVSKIGASAFQGSKKLKTVTIKTTKLTTKKVGKNAFKGISAKATVKVPKKVLKAYKKWLTKKGLPKKAKIK